MKRKTVIQGVAGMLLLTMLTGCTGGKEAQTIQTAQVVRRDLVDSISATGTVTGMEEENVLTTLTGYEITEVLVEVGDRVQVGSVLCRLDVSSVQDSLNTLNATIASAEGQNALSISSAQRQLQYAQQTADYQREMAQVSVNNAKEDLDKAQKDYDEAQTEYEEALADERDKKAVFDKLDAEFKKIQDRYNDRAADANEAAAKATSYQAELGIVNNEISVLEAEISALDKAITETSEQDKKTELERQKADKEAQKNTKTIRAAELQERYLQQNRVASEATVDFREYESTYNSKKADWTEAQTKYTEAKTERTTKEQLRDSLETALTSAQRSYDSAILAQENAKDSADNTVASSQENLKNTQLGVSSSMNSSYDQRKRYEEQLSDGSLSANVAGVVTQVNILENSPYTGGVMVVIENNSAFEVEAYVGEHEISDVCEGMSVRIRTDATGDEVLQGTVSFVSPVVDATRMEPEYLVRITVDTENDRLRLGMTARLSIELERRENAVTVPYDALQQDDAGAYFVQVLKEDDSTENVPVQLGITSAYYAEISGEGMEEGVTVVVPEADSGTSLEDMMDAMQGM